MSSFSDFKEILINIRKKKIKKLPNFNINNRDYLTNPKKWKL